MRHPDESKESALMNALIAFWICVIFAAPFIWYFKLPVVEYSHTEKTCVRVLSYKGTLHDAYTCEYLPKKYVSQTVR